jgi:hypothetical protein
LLIKETKVFSFVSFIYPKGVWGTFVTHLYKAYQDYCCETGQQTEALAVFGVLSQRNF